MDFQMGRNMLWQVDNCGVWILWIAESICAPFCQYSTRNGFLQKEKQIKYGGVTVEYSLCTE